ncbi:hypothetical protein INS90_09515 [Trueperella pecoris]|uniref:Uncharacterized protein n=1 Tax=Trueperella pecoris TaxID=2733571 RepID=A0A7M1QZM1_9ACTO|nr:hypothetical protein [Trueperella pecoris]QOR47469.1 hypothetical protein INS90_09515 [Trueperella pecoris]
MTKSRHEGGHHAGHPLTIASRRTRQLPPDAVASANDAVTSANDAEPQPTPTRRRQGRLGGQAR